ncbi:MAG TPA: glycosyltransferase family 39 protein, partial [Dehalococcoidia bacterium]|nr:glycosyltransferase family 39 protein [Dehalococcoidia bacterium]
MAVENSDSAIKGVNRREKKVLLTWSWIKRHRIILMLAMIVLISVFLRFYDLGTKSIWTNEAQSILESNLSVQGMVKASNQPPLYDLILHNWISLFGTSEAALRFPSAIFSVLTVVVIYFAGSALFHKRTGLIAAFISSFSSFLIAYSYDARDYALLALLSTLSYWFFIEIIRKDEKKYYAAYIVSSILLIFTHFYSLFIIASQVLFILIFIKKYKAKISKYAIIMGIPIMFGAIPMLMLLKGNISHIAEEGFWISVPGNLSTVETLVNFSGSGPAKYEIFGIFSLFAILGIFMLIKQRYRHTSTDVDQPRQSRLQSQEIIILLLL